MNFAQATITYLSQTGLPSTLFLCKTWPYLAKPLY